MVVLYRMYNLVARAAGADPTTCHCFGIVGIRGDFILFFVIDIVCDGLTRQHPQSGGRVSFVTIHPNKSLHRRRRRSRANLAASRWNDSRGACDRHPIASPFVTIRRTALQPITTQVHLTPRCVFEMSRRLFLSIARRYFILLVLPPFSEKRSSLALFRTAKPEVFITMAGVPSVAAEFLRFSAIFNSECLRIVLALCCFAIVRLRSNSH